MSYFKRLGTNGDALAHSDFAVAVSDGAAPTFSWDGGPVGSLSVIERGLDVMQTERWAIFADSDDGIASPVVYGVLPPATRAMTLGTWSRLAVPLMPGRTYLVLLYRRDGKIGGCFFTPTD